MRFKPSDTRPREDAHLLSLDDPDVNVEIRPYDEVDPDAVVWLNRLALDYEISPARLAAVRKQDPRLAPELAWYAVEHGEPVSQVAILLCPTRTTEGLETVGVPMMVCTHPRAAGRGFAKALLDHVHAWMRSKGVRLSLLTTSRFRVAYPMYRSVGYEDLARLRVASGRLRPRSGGRDRVRTATRRDHAVFHRIFEAHASEATGFVVRPRNFVEIRTTWGDVASAEMLALVSEGRTVGYAWARRSDPTHVRELVCRKGVAVEWAARLAGGRALTFVLSPRDSATQFELAGLRVGPAWGVVMVKDLSETRSASNLRALLGVDAGRFEARALDLY